MTTTLRARRRVLVLAFVYSATAVLFVAFRAQITPQLHRATGDLSGAHPMWVVGTAACFLAAALASAAAWRAALTACAGTIGYVDAAAKYAVGCFVNTFVPLRLGDAARVGLFSRAFDGSGRVLRTTGVLAFLGAGRLVALTLMLVPAVALGVLPLRMVILPAGLVAALVVVCVLRPERLPGSSRHSA